MLSPRSQGTEYGYDAKKYDPTGGQWMREAIESRNTIEELKALNDKLQREIYGLNSKMNLMYECCADMGIVDRLGDLMQRKLRDFQTAQVARNASLPANSSLSQTISTGSPIRAARKNDLSSNDEGFICGSPKFQDVAAFSSSYRGQVSRSHFHRVKIFDAEEAKLRDQMDIFGVPLQKPGNYSPSTNGDTIDNLLEATNSPMKSARHEGGAIGSSTAR
ncbi:hypothetical protein PHMEG_0002416 [Phytophthora megakarya]|uniref:Uncharacterized protein n=1 Tax=Phytophthora megakarya TaxID=4795 RepID=A0A225WZ62_9STRA|nr:hypothetical protein PHMEG_0002416 [Phytophthora megakarya]